MTGHFIRVLGAGDVGCMEIVWWPEKTSFFHFIVALANLSLVFCWAGRVLSSFT